MILKIVSVVLLYAYFSTDVYGTDYAPNSSPNFDQRNENVLQQKFPFQPYYNEERRTMKSCKHRPGFHDNDWVNTYKRRLILPSPSRNVSPINTELVSQSLKEENYQDPINNKLRRSGDDQDLKYAQKAFLNVLVDKNEDSTDDSTIDGELRTGLNEVSDPCNNYMNKLNIAEPGLNVDQKTSNRRMLVEANKNDTTETRISKSPKSGDLSLSPEDIQKLKNCVIDKPKSTKENDLPEQSNRILYNDDEDFLENENLGDTKRMNNEPHKSVNNYDSLEKPLDLNTNNERDGLPDPTKGVGITRLSGSKMLLSGRSRTCYACSSANSLNCLVPDRQTTVKYCRKDHNACVTKTFIAQNSNVIIRDCASSCDETESPGITLKYKSCVICHSDLCNDTNGAHSINSHYLIVGLIVMSFIRGTF